MDILRVFGISSLVVNIISIIPYYRDIFRNKTKPERATWFLWAFLGVILFFTNLAEGAQESLWFASTQVVIPVSIFLLSFRYGVGGFERRDKIALTAALAALVLWYLTDNAVVALGLALLIDAAGLVLTWIKTWKAPETETLFSWALLLLVGPLAMLSVGELDYVLLAFPTYISMVGLSMTGIIVYRRKVLEKSS